MTLDGQVLVVAFLALSLNVVVWGAGQDVVRTKEEQHRKDEFNLHLAGRDIPTWISDSHVYENHRSLQDGPAGDRSSSLPVAHVAFLEHGLWTCAECSVQRSWGPLNYL